MMRRTPILSKSRYLAGLQCPLRLWYQCYERHLATPVSPVQQALFDTGHEVGRLAARLYPGGVLIEEDYLHHDEAVQATQRAMADAGIRSLYEAGFVHNLVRVRADILDRVGRGRWSLIEVKSSTKLKEEHYPDVAVQYHVLTGSGIQIDRAGILSINNQYLYDGQELDLEDFFSFYDLTAEIIPQQEQVIDELGELRAMLARSEPPRIRPSRHCKNPYQCEFWEHCTADMPEFWVMQLPGIQESRLAELAAMGVEDIRGIPAGFRLSPLQERVWQCVVNGEEHTESKLQEELITIEYPIHFIDFETTGEAVPRYPNTRPYQTLPFQWSDHVLLSDGGLEHREYLCAEDKDPREEFTKTLLDALGTLGSIFIYTSYETTIMNELVGHLPQYAEPLLATLDRFKDLHAILRRHYYHPGFMGSFSLKAVLPALIPEMDYKNLNIQEGTEASLEYLRMIDPSTPEEQKEIIRRSLLEYCAHDTLSMVKIREKLLKRF